MWEDIKFIDVTSAFVGITTPLPEILNEIQNLGWEVDYTSDYKKDGYTVKATSVHGEKLEATGNTQETAAGNLLHMIQRLHSFRMPMNARAAAWHDSYIDLQEAIAHEYADAKMYDKKAASAWTELAEDCRRRVEIIQNEIEIEITDDPLPYKTFSEMAEDITQKGHFIVSRANASHPLWSINQIVDFRIAHDILGHGASGGDWSWFGINRAFQAHAPLLTYTAQKALFTEVIGQGAFNSYYGSHSQQKIAFLKIFDNPEAPEPYHHPVHPSQTIVPGPMAKIPNDANFDKRSSFDDLLDPNDGYETGVIPADNNAYNWHRIRNADGEMVDPLNSRGLTNMTHGIKSNWHELDDASREQAVNNAFSNAFLKPHKHDRAHAQHYQALHHLPGSVDDPARIWNALTHARDTHNNARGYLQANKELDPYMMPFKRHIQNIGGGLRHDQINDLADHHLLNMKAEEEREDKKKLGDDATSDDIHREATKRLIKRLKRMTNAKVNQDYDFGNEKMFFESKHPDSAIYSPPLAHQVKPIADIGKNIKDIVQIALEDIDQGGKGHHFRSSFMKQFFTDDMEPHQIDEAWFFLAPHTSQLGTINPDILKALGHKKDDMGIRDYFKAERQLQGARDASGYGHLPLGQFSRGLKNLMRHMPGHHPSKDHLHVLLPVPHDGIDWHNRSKKSEKPTIPSWFNDTKDIRKQIGKQWDRLEGVSNPKDAIPFRKKADAGFSSMLMPFYHHPDTKDKVVGRPGQRHMQHLIESLMLGDEPLSTPEIWALNPEVGREAAN